MNRTASARPGDRRHRRRRIAALVLAVACLVPLAACSSGGSDKVLRVAMGSPGAELIKVWRAIGHRFEAAHPGWKVQFTFQDDDQYSTIGLPNLLASRNAPDVYFEWVGQRLTQRTSDGFALDLTSAVESGALKGLVESSAYGPTKIGGRIRLFPQTEDVSSVLWFNAKLLREHGLEAPTTWKSLLGICRTLSADGVTPIALGNKDLWPAGNFGSLILSRVLGPTAYAKALEGGSYDTAAWTRAFTVLDQLRTNKCLNSSMDAIDDNAGAELFFQGKAAIHPIGSWLVSWALEEAPNLDFDFVNLPAVPDATGTQGSVLGVESGLVVNARTAHSAEAIQFLRTVGSTASAKAFAKAGQVPLTSTAEAEDARSSRLVTMMNSAPAIVSPPDTGYAVSKADKLYAAIAAVLGGQETPAQAAAAFRVAAKK